MAPNRDVMKSIFSRKMLVTLLLGFSSGLPLLLTGGTLKTWLAREGIDIKTIGYFAWVGLPYSLKFLWAPLIDRWTLSRFGRRRSWIILMQIALALSVFAIGTFSPAQYFNTGLENASVEIFSGGLSFLNGWVYFAKALFLNPFFMTAFLIAFFSATQDIAIDAFRREYLDENELGLGSTVNIYGYRIAMLISGGLGIGLVASDGNPGMSWSQLYTMMAGLMLVGVVGTLLASESSSDDVAPKSLREAVIDPFVEFFKRDGVGKALSILVFIFMFKVGDAISGSMLNPYYVQIGYSNMDIGFVAKTLGLFSSLGGMFIGGLVLVRLGIFRSLWIFGLLQALSTAAFALLTHTGPAFMPFAAVVVFEDLTSGMGTSAFVAFMAKVSNKRYTATQFALLSSLSSVGRSFISGFAGNMVDSLGWAGFYYACALIALPGILLAFKLKNDEKEI